MSGADWRIALAGECMVCRPFSSSKEPAFIAVIDRIRSADLALAHLEMNIVAPEEVDWPARNDWLASFMIAEPSVADDLQWAGFDMLSLAHNHSFDWGASGLLATIRHCRRNGITCAGTGRDLEEARKPQYRETSRGRAALISVSTGNKSNEWAGLPKATIKGRPGVNPLRAQFKYGIDKAAAHQLRRIIKELRIDYKQFDRVDGEMRLQFPELSASRSAPTFVDNDTFEISSTCHPADLEANLRSVREAREMADLTIVSHHFSVSDGPREDAPPRFVTQFARACIDNGADIYFGHGWHRTLGIEIYKGKPIFYGVGNFFAQSEFLDRVPSDSYESWGHDPDRLTTFNPAAEPLHPHLDEPTWWSTVLFELKMSAHRVSEIRLHPVSLGRDAQSGKVARPVGTGAQRKTDGRPFTAAAPDAAIILERIKTMSAALGTTIRLHETDREVYGLLTVGVEQ